MNPSEKNRQTLREAIRQLPQHAAPGDAWERIAQQLDPAAEETGHETLSRAVDQLPTYPAPAGLWQRIERRLPGSRKTWLAPALGWAATLLVVFSVWLALPRFELIPPQADQQTEVLIPDPARLHDWQEARAAEESLAFACLDSLTAEPELDSLLSQYRRVAASLDSLALLIEARPLSEPAQGRFSRQEQRRKQLLARIQQKGCE